MDKRRIAQFAVLVALIAPLAACGSDETSGTSTQTPMTISKARAQPEGTEVTIEGYVTVAPGTFNSATGEQGFAIQDDAAGIYVSLADKLDIALDKKVRVTGKLAQSAQQTNLNTDAKSVVVLSESRTIAPKIVLTGDVSESTEGLLITVSGQIKQPVGDDTPYGYKVFVSDGSGETQIFVHIVNGAGVIDTTSLMMDQSIQVTGLGAQYEATYEVAPRKADDLVTSP
jgi:uncharacterized protein YdeI (BOF family)